MRYGAAGRRARRDILHGCVDCLSRATLDACEKRRDQAERRKFRFFHKSLRLLNIRKVSLLQALIETRSKLFNHWTDYLLAKNQSRIASCNRQSEIYTLKSFRGLSSVGRAPQWH